MGMTKTIEGKKLTVVMNGRFDTLSATEIEKEITAALAGMELLELDMAKLQYISSAGLRVLLTLHKAMAANGGAMTLNAVPEDVMDILQITGFASILDIR